MNMKPLILLLFVVALINGACSSTRSSKSDDGPVTLRLTRSWLGGSDAIECQVAGNQLTMSKLIPGGSGKIEYFKGAISSKEVHALRSAILESGLLQRLNSHVYSKSEPPLLHSDGVVDAYQFPALVKGNTHAHSVRYHGVYDEGANRILHELNQLLPEKMRLEPLSNNEAPQPTRQVLTLD